MIYSFSLNRPDISCDKICHGIQKLINDYKNTNDINDSVVIVEIKPIISSQDNLGPLNLTYGSINQ
jgi:hypothetical protein